MTVHMTTLAFSRPRIGQPLLEGAQTPAPDIITGVPWHLRTSPVPRSEADNPLLVEALSAQAEHGDTPQQWADAIDAYLDGDGEGANGEVSHLVREVLGTPRSINDVDTWMARTRAWCEHALEHLNTDED